MRRLNVRLCGATALAGAALALAACDQTGTTTTGDDAAAASADVAAANAACGRDCLIGVAETYVAALVAHDPAQAPLADDVAFVENLMRIQPGEGLWQTAVSAPTSFEIHVPDEANQSVGYLAMMTRMAPPRAPQGSSPEEIAEFEANAEPSEQPVLVAFRLQLDENGEIAEAEHLLTGVREGQMPQLQTPRPGIFTEIPADQRKSHDELIEIGVSYYPALDDNDGTLMPFAPDCERHENGMITASSTPAAGAPAIPGQAPTPAVARDCAGQLSSNAMAYITTIDNRRVFAADPVTGLVMGLSHFRHPMDFEPYEVTHLDGTTSMRSAEDMGFAPFDLPAAHIFKVGADGMVHEIEAMGFQAPLNAATGWE